MSSGGGGPDPKTLARFLSRVGARPAPDPVRAGTGGVTVAIPNWNHEYVLPRSVGSALRAVRDLRGGGIDAEVLVVDDCSRDGSLALLRQAEALYAADGLRVLGLRRNIGLPAVRNLALREAAFDTVVFLDADNELVPDNLFAFYRSILATRAAAVYGNLLWRQADGGTSVLSNESFQHRMWQANYVDAFAMFDRAQLLDAGGYTDAAELEGREDWECYLHLAAAGRRIVFVPLVFGVYHELGRSMIDELRHTQAAQTEHLGRVFNQLGVRPAMPLNTLHQRFHPDLGYF
jgi:glycosyltransferase involved in cell wall biosynthesis